MSKFSENRVNIRFPEKDVVVIYHGNCMDGFCAAWSAWKKFGDSADYVAVKLGTPPPEELVGKEIYTLDFSYSVEHTQKLLKENKRLTSIDHHLTAKESAAMTTDYRFDMNHSGAVLAWEYFHPDEKLPTLLNYVEDFDLWRFKIPDTKAVVAYLDLFDFGFSTWDKIISDFEDPKKMEEVLPQANLILQYEKVLINRIVKNSSELVNFEGYRTYVINSPVFYSQIGEALYNRLPPMGIVWYRDKNRLKFSLRSDGSVDVSVLAKKFGGGGHRASSGFALAVDSPLPWEKINENEK